MPVVSVSRWQIDQNEALQIARDAAPMIKQHGAQTVSFGRIQTGDQAGQVTIVVTYANYEQLGQALEKARNDQQYLQLHTRALKAGRLISRNIVLTEELG